MNTILSAITSLVLTASTIAQGDCFDFLPLIPSGSVDMVLMDPPYGTTNACRWDTCLDLPRLWMELDRVTKPNAAVVMFGSQPFTTTLIASNIKRFRYEWVWIKSNVTGHLNAKKMPLKKHENVLVFYRSLPSYNPQMTKGKPYTATNKPKTSVYGNYKSSTIVNNGDRYPVSCAHFNNTTSSNDHPTQKPVPLLEYLIRTYTNEGDTVLDCTMGVGSTCVAAKNTGRGFIGIEMDPAFFAIAEQRLAD